MRKPKVLVVERQPVARLGLCSIVSDSADMELVGECRNHQGVPKQLEALDPDIVIVDIDFSEESDRSLVEIIRADKPERAVIAFTDCISEKCVMAATDLRINGYLLRDSTVEELQDALSVILDGDVYLAPKVASKLMSHLQLKDTQPQGPLIEPLTNRERQVLKLMARGKRNREIARTLLICERTVKYHVSSILAKLEVKNRTEAALMASKRKIVNPESDSGLFVRPEGLKPPE